MRSAFEVASIKPNISGTNMVSIMAPPNGGRLTARNVSLRQLITYAYKIRNFELAGGPGWMDSERYDVTAKAEDGASGRNQLQLMTRTLLEDRFQLMLHHETNEVPVYVQLFVGRRPAQLVPARSTERNL